MINISRLYCEEITPGDWLRYGEQGSGERAGEVVPKKASERKPIVVWNITRTCNLKCVHCYNDSGRGKRKMNLVLMRQRLPSMTWLDLVCHPYFFQAESL